MSKGAVRIKIIVDEDIKKEIEKIVKEKNQQIAICEGIFRELSI